MYLSDLALTDFRSYERAIVALKPGVTVLVGENGQGKTNLIEAVGYLSTLSSHRVSGDAALVRQGATAAVVQARVVRSSAPTTVEVEIYSGRANRARINRGLVRPPEIVGTVRSVLFAPEDLELVSGDPAARRSFLDRIMVQLRPRMVAVKSEYDRAARQRAALLKSAGAARRGGGSADAAALDVWDVQLAKLGARITAARAEIVARLRPRVDEFYAKVSGGRGPAEIAYRASAGRLTERANGAGGGPDFDEGTQEELRDVELNEIRLISAMAERREEEIRRGVNLVGPHRDELELALGTLPARGYASHGESWSYALALKLASWRVLCGDESGEWAEGGEPVLILDDVFAELDARRRDRLARIVEEAEQAIVTAAVGSELPAELGGRRLTVTLGNVSEEPESVSEKMTSVVKESGNVAEETRSDGEEDGGNAPVAGNGRAAEGGGDG
ncbi:DNA replication/repair protein RecF [Peptidiphaga gingivicola]|uniref:DNA replication and repair protein RecF n=1 Tax=Peptidiphaga gingivicola TaxID=2741497 RepID=A0A179B4M1_9ACTO|nr:DNA replication/repair protein RecF [Peptidiphaga gingivicola]OAP85984.1 DNA replication/repair protein RecF [Peptidiphaga gingivicola]